MEPLRPIAPPGPDVGPVTPARRAVQEDRARRERDRKRKHPTGGQPGTAGAPDVPSCDPDGRSDADGPGHVDVMA